MKRRLLLVALCAVLAMFTGACSSPDSPKAKPTASATPSQSQAPKMPALARENSEAGAEAAFRYFVATSNYSLATGELRPMRQTFDPNCEGCTTLTRYVSKVYEAGGYVKGNKMVIHSVETDFAEGDAFISAQVKTRPGSVSFGKGETPETIAPRNEPEDLFAALVFERERWIITQLGTEKG